MLLPSICNSFLGSIDLIADNSGSQSLSVAFLLCLHLNFSLLGKV